MGRLTTGLLFGCVVVVLAVTAVGCKHFIEKRVIAGGLLQKNLAWAGDNREVLERFIVRFGFCAKTKPEKRKPVRRIAVFDWDNTVIKNDIGDAMLYSMLKNGEIQIPPLDDWTRTSRYLTEAAASALADVCDPAWREPDDRDVHACTDEILNIYRHGVTRGGRPAFAGYNHHWMQPQYAWAAQLMAGHTPEAIRAMADDVIAQQLAADSGATMAVGSVTGLTGYIRIYEQMADLIQVLENNGFEVWIVSASSQHIVEPFAKRVGVPPERVIGVRQLLDHTGKLTYDLEGCGEIADGDNSLITYRKGKRCFINKLIFGGDPSEDSLEVAEGQILFAAGDSPTDLEFLQDATVLRLVIDRNKPELMCHALHHRDDGWIVNPMFIDPKPLFTGVYPCSSSACVDADGKPVACRDMHDRIIPDLSGVQSLGPVE